MYKSVHCACVCVCDCQVIFDVVCTSTVFSGTFDTVAVNIGGGWNTGAQVFASPVTGYYYLSYSAGSGASSQVWMNILVSYHHYCSRVRYTWQ
jgi:hypothetical protein